MNLTEAAAVLQLIDVENISKLDDQPNDVGGLSAPELKARFDKAGVDLKAFLLELVQAIIDGDEAAARGITQLGLSGSMIQNNSIPAEKLSTTAGAEAVYTDNMRDGCVTEEKLAAEFVYKITNAINSISGNSSRISSNAANIATLQADVASLASTKQNQHKTRQITLEANKTSWTKTVSGVTKNNTVFFSPTYATAQYAIESQVLMSAQGADSVTFKAKTAPTNAVVMNICIFD